MAAIGLALKSEDLARRSLQVLPPKFDGFVTALTTAVRPTLLTFEEFCSMIMEEEMRLKARCTNDEAYAANTKGKGKSKDADSSSESKKKKVKCFYCGKKGHIAKECRKKQADAKNGTLKTGETANVAKTTEVELFIAVEESCSIATHDSSWIIDSGASRHMTSHNDWYTSLWPTGEELKVSVGNRAKCPVKGVGTISFKTKEGATKELKDVLWVPDLSRNLLSVAAITDRDLWVQFDKKEALIMNQNNEIVANGIRRNNIYELLASTAQADVGTSRLWHERFGNMIVQALSTMQRGGMVVDLPSISDLSKVYEAYMKGKQQGQPFPQESSSRAKSPLELIHADLSGKMNTQALGGSSYYYAVIGDYNRKT
jgi:hypothetical protein